MATTQGIKLDDSTQKRLKKLATLRNRSPHWIMRTAIESYLEREEQYEQEKMEDMTRWNRYLDTGNAVGSDKVESWLMQLSQGKKISWRQ